MNDFRQKLEWANSEKLNPFWEAVYYEFFPDILAISNTIEDLELQKMGVDRVIHLENGKRYLIDEKIRENDWPDILLEYKSVADEYETIGWVEKPLSIDYLAYAFCPSQTCYLFDWVSLKRVWRYYGEKWKREYRTIKAQNNGYVTYSVAVPISILISKISACKKVSVNVKIKAA